MIYVFLANGFEEVEALTPVDVLRRGGVEVKTVGIGDDVIVGSHGIPVVADLDEDELDFDALSGVILPGGMPGTRHLDASETVKAALAAADQKGALIAAICAAPSVLGHNGLLRGKRATCFPGFEDELEGATLCTDLAVTDGNVITGKGAGAALPFALALLAYLKGADVAAQVKSALQCG